MPCTLKCSWGKMTFSFSATIPLFTYKLAIISLWCLHLIRITIPRVLRVTSVLVLSQHLAEGMTNRSMGWQWREHTGLGVGAEQ